MKKVFLAIAVASVFTACNNGDSSATKTDSTVVKVDSPVVVAPKVDSPVVIKVDSPVVKKDTTKKM